MGRRVQGLEEGSRGEEARQLRIADCGLRIEERDEGESLECGSHDPALATGGAGRGAEEMMSDE